MKKEKLTEKLFQLGYAPLEDITAWEVARVQALLMEMSEINHPLPESWLKNVESDVLRHFKREDVTDKFNEMIKSMNKETEVVDVES